MLSYLLALATLCGTSQDQTTPEPALLVPTTVVDGFDPGIRVLGAQPGEVIRLHVVRSLVKWAGTEDGWRQIRQPLHAWADYQVAADGSVAADLAAPLAGTHSVPDSLALLRNGRPFGSKELANVRSFDPQEFEAGPPDRVWIRVEQTGEIVCSSHFDLTSDDGQIVYTEFLAPGLHGIFARPKGTGRLPVVVALHGSEGGSRDRASAIAAAFAMRGFAVLALNYFAYPHESIEGLPTEHLELSVEGLQQVRNWLAERGDIDLERIALYGVSKGAEFALLAATQYDWIDRVIAVVPSDVVWAGYGNDDPAVVTRSSWSIGGTPVPCVPLFTFDPAKVGQYRKNTERYSRSRTFWADRVDAARIPIEKTAAEILLLAGDLDEVWASGDMSRNLVERMEVAGLGARVTLHIYPTAGHQLAGVGTFPIWLYGVQSEEPGAKDLLAEGAAAADSWRRTISFLGKEPAGN